MPSVIGNWWRTAGGEVVLLAANLTDKEQTLEYRVFGSDQTATLTLRPLEIKRIIPLSH
jgi:hypothetical protein